MKKIYLPFFFLSLLFSACSTDNDDLPKEIQTDTRNLEVEEFIYRAMKEWYLYEAEIPEFGADYFADDKKRRDYLATFESPEDLFEDLQASHDRFSFMWDDYRELEKLLYEGVQKSTGMVYGLRLYDTDKVLAIVWYVLPGSPAEQQGIIRGDAFTEIDGQQMTLSNYQSLLGLDSFTIRLATLDGEIITNTDRTVSLSSVEMKEDPVFMDTVFDQDGIRTGYLLYNGFTLDFDSRLNEVFGDFKSQGIQNLVIDLRYNGGGSVETAVDLASMITGHFEGQLFTQTMLNDKWQEIYESQSPESLKYRFNNQINTGENINSLQLSSVHIIATQSSASASELLINGLRPYIDVVHVGEKTAGKYQGSRTLYDSDNIYFSSENVNPNHTYAIQPLIMKLANAQGVTDYANGLQPDISVSEDLGDLGALGDPSEPLLQAALNDIRGVAPSTTSAMARQAAESFRYLGSSEMLEPTYQRMYINSKKQVQK